MKTIAVSDHTNSVPSQCFERAKWRNRHVRSPALATDETGNKE